MTNTDRCKDCGAVWQTDDEGPYRDHANGCGEMPAEIWFDPPADVELARQAGIDQSGDTAGGDWKTEAAEQVRFLARTLDDFTTDEVIARLELLGVVPSNLMALGAVMQSAARAGVIRKTGEVRRTKIARRHRDLTVWCAA
jgi:hypothetical protein